MAMARLALLFATAVETADRLQLEFDADAEPVACTFSTEPVRVAPVPLAEATRSICVRVGRGPCPPKGWKV